MNTKANANFAGISGILFVVLSVAIVAAGPPPPTLTATAQEIVAYYAAHRMPFLIGNYLGVLAFAPGFVLMAYLAGLLKRAEGEAGWLWLIVLGSYLVTAAVSIVDLIFFQATALSAEPGNEAIAKALSDLANLGFSFLFVTVVAFGAAVEWAVLKTGFLPRWVGHASLAVAGLSLVASLGTVVTTGALAAGGIVTLLAFGAFALLSLAVSILVMMGIS